MPHVAHTVACGAVDPYCAPQLTCPGTPWWTWIVPIAATLLGGLLGAWSTRSGVGHSNDLARTREAEQLRQQLLRDRCQRQQEAIAAFMRATTWARNTGPSGPRFDETEAAHVRALIRFGFESEAFADECYRSLVARWGAGQSAEYETRVRVGANLRAMLTIAERTWGLMKGPGIVDPMPIRADALAEEDRALDAATKPLKDIVARWQADKEAKAKEQPEGADDSGSGDPDA